MSSLFPCNIQLRQKNVLCKTSRAVLMYPLTEIPHRIPSQSKSDSSTKPRLKLRAKIVSLGQLHDLNIHGSVTHSYCLFLSSMKYGLIFRTAADQPFFLSPTRAPIKKRHSEPDHINMYTDTIDLSKERNTNFARTPFRFKCELFDTMLRVCKIENCVFLLIQQVVNDYCFVVGCSFRFT